MEQRIRIVELFIRPSSRVAQAHRTLGSERGAAYLTISKTLVILPAIGKIDGAINKWMLALPAARGLTLSAED
jgi:hypothetical protein